MDGWKRENKWKNTDGYNQKTLKYWIEFVSKCILVVCSTTFVPIPSHITHTFFVWAFCTQKSRKVLIKFCYLYIGFRKNTKLMMTPLN
jgi:hypothetical protein